MKYINLLPKNRQQELRYEALLSKVYFLIIISLVSFAVVFFTQFLTKIYLQKKLNEVTLESEQIKKQINKQDNSEVKEKVAQINSQILDYKNLVDLAPRWSKLLKAFAKLPPKGVLISSLSVDEIQGRVMVTGFSPSRELVLEFYDNINADTENFSGLEKFLENIAKPKDVNFHLNFQFKPELLK